MGLTIDNYYMRILAFADDIVMIARGYEEAQEMMFTLEAVLKRYSLELNVNKTKYIASNEGRITYQGTDIERVREYKYLGKII